MFFTDTTATNMKHAFIIGNTSRCRLLLQQMLNELHHGATLHPGDRHTLSNLLKDKEFRGDHGATTEEILAQDADNRK